MVEEGPKEEKSTDEIVGSMTNFISENSFVLETSELKMKVVYDILVNVNSLFVCTYMYMYSTIFHFSTTLLLYCMSILKKLTPCLVSVILP